MIRFKFCPKCSALFDCYCDSNKDCWCSDLKISSKNLEIISRLYAGCLCPSCLKGFEQKVDESVTIEKREV